jgi:hypothetical protein
VLFEGNSLLEVKCLEIAKFGLNLEAAQSFRHCVDPRLTVTFRFL